MVDVTVEKVDSNGHIINIRTKSEFKGIMRWLLKRELKNHLKTLKEEGLVTAVDSIKCYFTVTTLVTGEGTDEFN